MARPFIPDVLTEEDFDYELSPELLVLAEKLRNYQPTEEDLRAAAEWEASLPLYEDDGDTTAVFLKHGD